ncbi:hypothetical protein [Mucilaginibacter flavus]|uniref:hypothetical protein n=1 Tax=Mucilaginibacter flavus TaxID=931504 RepID=UPI0025B36363|nr:hypothetical protein [Mucilaginibacter flavus]MDN3580274.1 hypothetical protein [Mucilaginibacter flavus]
MNKKVMFKLGWRLLFTLLIFISTVFLPIISKAQTSIDCGDGQDPFNNACPLDTWVIVLAITAGALTTIHLYRKQKAA